jgi:hypothetical protein
MKRDTEMNELPNKRRKVEQALLFYYVSIDRAGEPLNELLRRNWKLNPIEQFELDLKRMGYKL